MADDEFSFESIPFSAGELVLDVLTVADEKTCHFHAVYAKVNDKLIENMYLSIDELLVVPLSLVELVALRRQLEEKHQT